MRSICQTTITLKKPTWAFELDRQDNLKTAVVSQNLLVKT